MQSSCSGSVNLSFQFHHSNFVGDDDDDDLLLYSVRNLKLFLKKATSCHNRESK